MSLEGCAQEGQDCAPPGCVCLDGVPQAALGKLGLTGLLAFLSRFCSDTGPLLLHNLNINYYFKKKPRVDGMQHSLLKCLNSHVVFLCFPPI